MGFDKSRMWLGYLERFARSWVEEDCVTEGAHFLASPPTDPDNLV
jgi:hypothetical protein